MRTLARGICAALFVFVSFPFACAHAYASTAPPQRRSSPDYYVAPNGSDKNDGSRMRPWATIAHAADSVGDGATVHVLAGTYRNGKVTASRGGTFSGSDCSSRVRFLGDYDLATRTWNTKVVSTDADVWESTAPCVDVEGMELSSTNGGNGAGMKLSGRGDRLISSHVHDVGRGTCVLGGGKADYVQILGNWVHRCGAADHSSNLDHGIYMGNDHITVVNNVVYDASAYCIVYYTTNPGVPSYSTIANNTMWNCKYGIGIDGKGADYNVITNNIARDLVARGPGITIKHYGAHTLVANNLLWNISGPRYDGSVTPQSDINADPLFVKWAADGTGDYRLAAGSPARDSGVSTGAPATDFFGSPRPRGAAFDRGAFEYVP